MPVIEDPESVLTDHKNKLSAGQIIMLLLYPVIFAVGVVVGLVVGIKQGEHNIVTQQQQNQNQIHSTIIPNANNKVNSNISNTNVTVSNALNDNSNSGLLTNSDY